ncbi:hypothetical protein CWI66_16225 [Halomonas sp. 141]|uniref:DUF4760 domain-containing protein n=1 Tax=Halomonas sp. 141 TaxID=2056666 RepID=UPI000C29EBDD|nr:DUF4760 domain-containing protein [Halomonas sp. 141]PJX12712.1 hypothetical protein CWI66_16225 [Halomonas sp. 141]
MLLSVLTALGTLLSGIATTIAIVVAYKVHMNQKLLSQRQLLLPLWEYMATLSKIDPNEPITPDVVKVVNTLELVALCCEGGMVDERVVKRTFREQFIERYEEVKKCSSLKDLDCSGEDILKQNRAATEFYNTLEQERLSQDRI